VDMYTLDTNYKSVGQPTRFYTLEEAIEAAAEFTRAKNQPLAIWKYDDSQERSLEGSVQPDGTLVKPSKKVSAVVAALYDKGHVDLANELLNS